MKGIHFNFRAAAMGLVGALLVAGSAYAADPLVEEKSVPGKFSANVALTSEYYFRGLSQTDDAPALQGGLDYEVGLGDSGVALYLGLWGSNVNFNDSDQATVETDFYGGLRGSIGKTGLGWDVGFIYYAYPGAASSLNYDFVEVQGALSYDFGVAAVTGSVNYSPENFGDSGPETYIKGAIDVPVGKYLTLSGYVAKQYIDKNDVFGAPDYIEWNISAGVNIAGFDVSVAYSDTDIDPAGDGNEGAVIFTVSRSF